VRRGDSAAGFMVGGGQEGRRGTRDSTERVGKGFNGLRFEFRWGHRMGPSVVGFVALGSGRCCWLWLGCGTWLGFWEMMMTWFWFMLGWSNVMIGVGGLSV
jgi:hypothetical protein